MAAPDDRWKKHFIAYEDALASFYALENETRDMLERSRMFRANIARLDALRKSVLEEKRWLRVGGDAGNVPEIARPQGTIEINGVPLDVEDIGASRTAPGGRVLELSFRLNAQTTPRFVNVNGPIRIQFPFGDGAYVASFELARFTVEGDYFAFRFATVDPS